MESLDQTLKKNFFFYIKEKNEEGGGCIFVASDLLLKHFLYEKNIIITHNLFQKGVVSFAKRSMDFLFVC